MTSSNDIQDFTYQDIKRKMVPNETDETVSMDQATRIALEEHIEGYSRKIAELLQHLNDGELRKVLQSSLIV